MKKRIAYSEEYLQQLTFGSDEMKNVFIELNSLAAEGKTLSLAEEHFRGRHLSVLHGEDGEFMDIHQWPGGKDYLFSRNYLYYLNNFEGIHPVIGPFGRIPRETVEKDVRFLEEVHQNWLQLLNDPKSQEHILQGISKEAKEHIKKSEEYGKQLMDGSFRRASRNKSVALHSKYIFLKVKRFFQEHDKNEIKVELCGKVIEIDARAHYHILMRHFAAGAKPYQVDADYHKNEEYHPDALPDKLVELINEYTASVPCDKFVDKIFVEIKGVLHSIRFAPKKGQQGVLRLVTFFPVEKGEIKQQTAAFTEYQSSGDLVFFA